MCAVRCLRRSAVSEHRRHARKVFLGNFFAPATKLPALMRGSSFSQAKAKALDSRPRGNDGQGQERKAKSLDSGFRRNDEREPSRE
jgi:hypothetical protein